MRFSLKLQGQNGYEQFYLSLKVEKKLDRMTIFPNSCCQLKDSIVLIGSEVSMLDIFNEEIF